MHSVWNYRDFLPDHTRETVIIIVFKNLTSHSHNQNYVMFADSEWTCQSYKQTHRSKVLLLLLLFQSSNNAKSGKNYKWTNTRVQSLMSLGAAKTM